MIINYTWKIISVDDTNKTMVVEYTNTDTQAVKQFNIRQPLAGVDVTAHVALYAPVMEWTQTPAPVFAPVVIGAEGTAVHDTDVAAATSIVTASTASDMALVAAIQRTISDIAASTV